MNPLAYCIPCLVLALGATFVCIFQWIRYNVKKSRGYFADDKLTDGKKRSNKNGVFTSFSWLVIGIFVSAAIMFVPIYLNDLETPQNWSTYLKLPFLCIHNALRLFVVDADFGNVRDVIGMLDVGSAFKGIYTVVFACYYVIAPLLTGAFVLSLIKGLYEKWRYYIRRNPQKLYIMSELNENSLALAYDILNNYEYRDEDVLTEDEKRCKTDIDPTQNRQEKKVRRTLIFANVTQNFQEEHPDLVERAQDLGAICLGMDITEISLKSPKRKMYRKLYLIGENEDNNVDQAMKLIDKCFKNGYNVPHSQFYIYVFAISEESGIVLDSCIDSHIPKNEKGNMIEDENGEVKPEFYIHVRRVDEKRNFIWKTVLRGAKELNIDEEVANSSPRDELSVHDSVPYIFSSALPERDGLRDINILIVGLGGYGRELLQTLCWFCQMPGYRLTIHAMDGDADCESKIRALSPELINPRFADPINDVIGESRYNLQFHNKPIDVNSSDFREEVMSIKDRITLAFVTLGDDKTNVDTAIKLSRFFGIMYPEDKQRPYILCTVYDSDKADHLDNGRALIRKKTDYRIRFIGDHGSRYRLENVVQPRLERMGEAVHMLWALTNATKVKEYEKKLKDAERNGNDNEINENKDQLIAIRKEWSEGKASYNFVEYNRLSSKARSLYMIARETMLDEISNGMTEAQKINLISSYEHRRWNAYVRAMGYVYGKESSHIYQVHNELIPYNELEKHEKDKDSYVWSKLVEEVANADINVRNSAKDIK